VRCRHVGFLFCLFIAWGEQGELGWKWEVIEKSGVGVGRLRGLAAHGAAPHPDEGVASRFCGGR
ncbi:MAG: hypothetical protein ABSF12_01290, partial [Bryobacteraceae bacterium]